MTIVEMTKFSTKYCSNTEHNFLYLRLKTMR